VTKAPRPLEVVEPVAQHIRRCLASDAHAFRRIEIAGSIRRRKPMVGDIELVAEIDPESDLGATDRVKLALRAAGVRRANPITRSDGVEVKAPWGDRYLKGLYGGTPLECQVDLFIVRPPAEWGVVFLIRTGSAEFSQAVVTRLHRYALRTEEGHIISKDDDGTVAYVPCESEEEFFRLARLPVIPPEKRFFGEPATDAAFKELPA
jgi:DNA polymerase/3'-5' exonuclease PolX